MKKFLLLVVSVCLATFAFADKGAQKAIATEDVLCNSNILDSAVQNL